MFSVKLKCAVLSVKVCGRMELKQQNKLIRNKIIKFC